MRYLVIMVIFLALIGVSAALNASFNQNITVRATNSNAYALLNQPIIVNLSNITSSLNSGCSDVMWTLNVSDVEIDYPFFNVSANSTPPFTHPCNSTSAYFYGLANISASSVGEVVGWISFNGTSYSPPPFKLFWDDFLTDDRPWLLGISALISPSEGIITVGDGTSTTANSRARVNADQNETVLWIKTVSAPNNGAPIVGVREDSDNTNCVLRGSIPRKATTDVNAIYKFFTGACNGVGSVDYNGSANDFPYAGGIWREEVYGMGYKLYWGQNTTANITLGNVSYSANTFIGATIWAASPNILDGVTATYNPLYKSVYGILYNWTQNITTEGTSEAGTLAHVSPLNSTYNTTAIPYNINGSGSSLGYTCNYTRNGVTNATNFTMVNNTNYTAGWSLPYAGYTVTTTCSNSTETMSNTVVFANRLFLGWVNTTQGVSFANATWNETNCTASIFGSPRWVNFSVYNSTGNAVFANINGTPYGDGNWSSMNFTPFIAGIWSCNVSAFDGTSIITNSTQFSVTGASPPYIEGITTNKGSSFELGSLNDTYCLATVTDPDGNGTIRYANFTITNPSSIVVVDNVNGSNASMPIWTSRNFTPSLAGAWSCCVRVYDGTSQVIKCGSFTVTSPGGGEGGGGGGGGPPNIIQQILNATAETYNLPALKNVSSLWIALGGVVIVFILLDQYVNKGGKNGILG